MPDIDEGVNKQDLSSILVHKDYQDIEEMPEEMHANLSQIS